MSKNSTINDQKDLRNKPLDCNDETLLDESVSLLLNNRPALHKAVSTLLQKGSLVQLADLLKLSTVPVTLDTDSMLYYGIFNMLIQLELIDDMWPVLTELTDKDPQSTLLHFYKGCYFYAKKDYIHAVDQFEQVQHNRLSY